MIIFGMRRKLSSHDLFKYSFVTLIGVSLFMIVGCGYALYRIYDGPPRLKNEVAVLLCPPGTTVKLFKIDGKEGPFDSGPLFSNIGEYNSRLNNSFCIELLPGKHTLAVAYYRQYKVFRSDAASYSEGPHIIECETQAGRTYTIEFEIKGKRAKAKIVEVKQ